MSTLHLGVCEWAMSLLVGKSEEIGKKLRSKFGENDAQTSFQKRSNSVENIPIWEEEERKPTVKTSSVRSVN